MAAQHDYVPPDMFVDPAAFTGHAPSGASLHDYLSGPAYDALARIKTGMSADQALAYVSRRVEELASLGIADAARQAAGADTATRPGVGYIRVCSPGACARCIILAGKFFRWNQGFLRHPHCYCRHVPASKVTGEREITDPMDAFWRMSEKEQNRTFGRYSAQAIRDGADISQVVNARSGVAPIGSKARPTRRVPDWTTYGTANRRGFGRSYFNEYVRVGNRMTPEGCYRAANGKREQALRLLEDNGYIIRQEWRDERELLRPNAGAMGRGGRSKGHTAAYREAMRTGVRDPNEPGTMTAAERRLENARLRYVRALSGSDMREMAEAERNYRRWLASDGQIHTR